jgi:hypothetical protein
MRRVFALFCPLLFEVLPLLLEKQCLTAARLLLAIIRASSIVFARSWSRGTRWLNSPMRYASSASTTRAVNKSSLAMGQPTWLGKVQALSIRP